MFDFDTPSNLVEMIEGSISKFSERAWFGTKNKKNNIYEWVTYGETGKRIDNLRSGLSALGIAGGDTVAIIANNSVEWAVAYYATLGLNGCFVPMYEAEIPETWKYILQDSGAKILFTANKKISDTIMKWKGEMKALEHVILIHGEGNDSMRWIEETGMASPVKSIYPSPDDTACLIYTSGTTGNPKGVILTHGNITSNVHAALKAFPMIDMTKSSLSFLPWAHSYGQSIELNFGSYAGGSTGFAEKPATIINDILIVRPTNLISVPRVFNLIYDGIRQKLEKRNFLVRAFFSLGVASGKRVRENALKGRKSLIMQICYSIADRIMFRGIKQKLGGRMEFAISSGAALSPAITEFFFNIGIPVYEAWGMTELSPAVAMNSPSSYKIGTVGRVIDKVRIAVDRSNDGHGSREGELVVYGPNVMKGYHNQPKLTEETMTADGGLRTGDMGYIDDEGFIFITGRIKEQFKLENGKFVYPVSIEEEIKLNPFVEQAFVYGINKPYTVCIIYPNFSMLHDIAAKFNIPANKTDIACHEKINRLYIDKIKKQLEGTFGSYEIPKKCIIIDEGFTLENKMLTQSFKLKRNEILKKYNSKIEELYR